MDCIKCGAELPDNAVYCHLCGKKQTVVKKEQKRTRGNHQGCAYRRPGDKSWRAIVTLGYKTVDGKRKRIRKEKCGFSTKTNALAYIDDLTKSKSKECPTINKLWEQYSGAAMEKLSANKQSAYRTAYKKMDSIKFMKIDDLTTKDLQDIVDQKVKTFYPAKDIRDLLSHFYQIAMADQFVPSNLSQHIVLPEKDEVIPNPFTEDEQTKLWDDYAAGSIFTGYILLMIYTSMMPGELLSCRKEWIDWDNKQIVGAGIKTKKRKATPIVLADIIVPVLENLCENSKGEKIITINKDRFYDAFHATIERLQMRSDLQPYSCRHTTATALVAADIAPSVVQEVMRHSKFSSTQRYIHIIDQQTHDAVNRIKTKNA